jgi:hypothetical protein
MGSLLGIIFSDNLMRYWSEPHENGTDEQDV